MHLCMSCTHIHAFVREYLTFTNTYVREYKYLCVSLYSHTWVCTHAHEFVLLYVYLCVSLCSYTYICVWVLTHKQNFVCEFRAWFLCMSICAWVKTHEQKFVCEVRAWVSCVGSCVSTKLTYKTKSIFGCKICCGWIRKYIFGISRAPIGTYNKT